MEQVKATMENFNRCTTCLSEMSVTYATSIPNWSHESGLLGEDPKVFQMTMRLYYESSCWRTSLFRSLW